MDRNATLAMTVWKALKQRSPHQRSAMRGLYLRTLPRLDTGCRSVLSRNIAPSLPCYQFEGLAIPVFCIYKTMEEITFDPAKRAATLRDRGLDFADAPEVFAGREITIIDHRRDYGEVRYITAGYLDGDFVVLVWTQRDKARHVISMRYGHAKEEARFGLSQYRP